MQYETARRIAETGVHTTHTGLVIGALGVAGLFVEYMRTEVAGMVPFPEFQHDSECVATVGGVATVVGLILWGSVSGYARYRRWI